MCSRSFFTAELPDLPRPRRSAAPAPHQTPIAGRRATPREVPVQSTAIAPTGLYDSRPTRLPDRHAETSH